MKLFSIARYANLLNISSYMLVQRDGRYLGSTILILIPLFFCSDFSTGPAAVAVEIPRLTYVNAFAGNCSRWILESVAVLAFGITSQMADETLVVADMAHNITVKSTKTPSFPNG